MNLVCCYRGCGKIIDNPHKATKYCDTCRPLAKMETTKRHNLLRRERRRLASNIGTRVTCKAENCKETFLRTRHNGRQKFCDTHTSLKKREYARAHYRRKMGKVERGFDGYEVSDYPYGFVESSRVTHRK